MKPWCSLRRHDATSPLSIRFQNVAAGRARPRDDSDPALWTVVRRDRRRATFRASARQAGPVAACLPGAQPHSARRPRRADRRAVARSAAGLRRRGAANAAVPAALLARDLDAGGARRADPGAARAGVDRRRGCGGRGGARARRARRGATRAARGRWRRCRSTSRAAGCSRALRRRGSRPRGASSRMCASRRSR